MVFDRTLGAGAGTGEALYRIACDRQAMINTPIQPRKIGSEISSVRLTGVKEGLRVIVRQQPAPNEFVYLATDEYVYGLIPFDAKGGKMLRSFRLIPDSTRAHMRH